MKKYQIDRVVQFKSSEQVQNVQQLSTIKKKQMQITTICN